MSGIYLVTLQSGGFIENLSQTTPQLNQEPETRGILVITWNFPPRRGGIENLTSNLCRGLKASYSVFVITSGATVRIPEVGVFRPRWRGLIPFFIFALWYGGLLLWKHRGIKVVLGGSALVTPLVLCLARLFRRKAVVNVHGLDLIYPSFLYQSLVVRWLKKLDQVVANSQHTASVVLEKRVKQTLVSVIPPSVDCSAFASFRVDEVKKGLGLDGRKVILSVGRLTPRKGVKEFLENSLPGIVKEVPDTCFLIVGENPTEALIRNREDMMGQIKNLIKTMGLEKHVRLLGGLSDGELVKVYQASDLVLLPALWMKEDAEGFGIVMLEGAAAGRPSVATRVGGIPDAVEDKKSGILVEPGDYPSITRTVIDLLRDHKARLTMGEFARSRAQEKFSIESVAKQYGQLFQSLSQ